MPPVDPARAADRSRRGGGVGLGLGAVAALSGKVSPGTVRAPESRNAEVSPGTVGCAAPRVHKCQVSPGTVRHADVCPPTAAECVAACPSDAIHWNGNGALLITESCTGCGACVPACPYDAVQMVAQDTASVSPLWSLWHRITHSARSTIPLEASQPQLRADKCDLCHGYDDLACVSACPTGALQLRSVEELFPF